MTIIFFVLFLLCCTSSVLSVKDDEKVLLKIKKQLGDPDSLSWWVTGFDYCDASANTGPDFSYITCTDTGRVRSILLQNLNVNAPFPDAICDLTYVQDLLLNNDPGLYGSIPSCITQLPNLWEVIITDTSFSEFSDNLYGFDLSHNKIFGKVPDSFATAAGLYFPNLSFNRLCGELPQGGNMGRFSAAVFANNSCLCGNPLPPCSTSAPAPAS
ncbi:Polygalacturonase inhibitor [Rhynchospora pubera]|uniref:Polygalacturonase inhibitor n=1 Tax=Rhynchospora pubera TaxID=906938 RepID=A0AAV8H4F9_9POAL|nr:Polygalacturonase inhibitor [Rhynchospora pubera]